MNPLQCAVTPLKPLYLRLIVNDYTEFPKQGMIDLRHLVKKVDRLRLLVVWLLVSSSYDRLHLLRLLWS